MSRTTNDEMRAAISATALGNRPACPFSHTACAGRKCACAARVEAGFCCGVTSGPLRRVVDVDIKWLLKSLLDPEHEDAARAFLRDGMLFADARGCAPSAGGIAEDMQGIADELDCIHDALTDSDGCGLADVVHDLITATYDAGC